MADDPPERQLRHEVALILPAVHRASGSPFAPGKEAGGQVISAPALYDRCRGMEGMEFNTLVQKVENASRERRLLCVVCAAPLTKKFGRHKAWHFATKANHKGCDHEPESVVHRKAKLALRDALRQSLREEWEVNEEVRLENGRRPDVLATNVNTGTRVAFEVQYADLGERDLEARRKDYAALGVRDVWLLGHLRREMNGDILAASLAAASDQHTLYVGSSEIPHHLHIEEGILVDPSNGTHQHSWPARWPARPGDPGRLPPLEWVSYPARALRLSASGDLFTPSLKVYGKLKSELEYQRKASERRQQAEARRIREAESRRRWAHERRAEEARSWRESAPRLRAIDRLGAGLVEDLERETKLDRNVYTAPGRWKVLFFLKYIHDAPPGTTFDYFAAGWRLLNYYGYSRRSPEWAWRALHDFRDRLDRLGYIEFDRPDARGSPRFWRVTRPVAGRRFRRQESTRAQEVQEYDRREEQAPASGQGKFYSARELRELKERNNANERDG